MSVLVTGGAGFIGSHLCEHLVRQGHRVIAIDNLDRFYDPRHKLRNLARIVEHPRFQLLELDICDQEGMRRALDGMGIEVLIHLAARAGVRPSIDDPCIYSRVNVEGTAALLELARRLKIGRFIFGSSSSVYGNSARGAFNENDPADSPISPYAATKRAGELLCRTSHHLYGLSVVCLRFFTVYGPRQRPDLAIHKFARCILAGVAIPFYGDGSTERDYTYVEDIVGGIGGAIEYTRAHPGCFEILNLGHSRPVPLRRLVDLLGQALELQPEIEYRPAQAGDVMRTCADVRRAEELLGYRPRVPIEEGLRSFAEWLQEALREERTWAAARQSRSGGETPLLQ